MVEGKVALPKEAWREVWRETMAMAQASHWYYLDKIVW